MKIYREVERQVDAIRRDNRNGAVTLTKRAARVIQLLARESKFTRHSQFLRQLRRVLRELTNAQPMMASMFTLANEVLWQADHRPHTDDVPEGVLQLCSDFIRRLDASIGVIATAVTALLRKKSVVVTHSFSATILRSLVSAFHHGKGITVVCTESRPMCEGMALARELRRQGISTTLVPDAAVFTFIPKSSCILVGADAITTRGAVNKIGTMAIASVAQKFDIPFYVVCDSAKFLPAAYDIPDAQLKESTAFLSRRANNIKAYTTYFDLTPLDQITAVISEKGTWTPTVLRRHLKSLRIHPALIP